MHAFVVLGFVLPYQAKRLAWGTSLKWPILCWVGRKTWTQSINCARWVWSRCLCCAVLYWFYWRLYFCRICHFSFSVYYIYTVCHNYRNP